MTTYGGRYKGRANTGSQTYESFKSKVDSDIKKNKEKEAFNEANTIKPDYYFQGQKMDEKDYNLAVMAAKGNKGKIMPGTSPALDQLAKTQEAADIQAQAQANMQDLAKQNQIAQAQEQILNAGQTTDQTVATAGIPGQAQPIGQTGAISTQDTTGGIKEGETSSLLPYAKLETYADPVDLRVRDFIDNSLKSITGEKFAESLSNFVLATQAETKKSGVVSSSLNIGQRFIKGLFSFAHAKGTNADFNNAEDVANTWIGMIDKEIKEGNDPILVNQYIATAEDSLSAMEDEAKYYGILNAGYWKNQGADLQTAILQKRKMLKDLKDKATIKAQLSNYGL